ncbi:MAG: L,D-transpeptidase family protein [Bacillota bacterium]|nr:L,D-transpeptidase family protein [Bacillota bacterium]
MKKAFWTVIAVIAVVIACLAIAAVSYTHSDDYTNDSFSQGVTINGLDCSGLTYDEAASALTDYWNGQKMVVVGNLDEPLEEYTDFGCTYDIAGNIAGVKKNHLIKSALNHYLHIPYSVQIAMNVEKTTKKFRKTVKNSPFLSHGNAQETQDAYVDMSDPSYPIVPEVYGNKPDTEAYLNGIIKGIELGELRFKFDEKDYIDIPEVKSDDPELLNYQRCCREYLSQKISYKLGDESFTISAEDLFKMYDSLTENEIDKKAVAKYVKKMAEKYNTIGENVKFTSFTGKTFTINGGTYGWAIDQGAEAEQLAKDIKSHKDVKREPKFSSRGSGTYSKLVGDTYVDIDITKQHAVYFENGKNRFETDVVTGCVAAGHSTPTGLFQVLNKQRDITLKGGSKKKKTYYESFVHYWIGFFGSGYGMHDASWRSSFGGEIYKYSGSHGCVNMPPSRIPDLYNIISIGTPVIVHY